MEPLLKEALKATKLAADIITDTALETPQGGPNKSTNAAIRGEFTDLIKVLYFMMFQYQFGCVS